MNAFLQYFSFYPAPPTWKHKHNAFFILPNKGMIPHPDADETVASQQDLKLTGPINPHLRLVRPVTIQLLIYIIIFQCSQ